MQVYCNTSTLREIQITYLKEANGVYIYILQRKKEAVSYGDITQVIHHRTYFVSHSFSQNVTSGSAHQPVLLAAGAGD